MKLIEGSRYNFKVEKQINLDGKHFWVLTGPDKKKYLLDCSEYSKYKIKIDDEINCRLDKINCKGEVFLEPLHPYYREGSVYDFTAISYETRIDKSGVKQDVVILHADNIESVVVPVKYFSGSVPQINTRVSIKIDQIIKGVIYVSGASQPIDSDKSEDSDLYNFLILNQSRGIDGRVYFVISDEEGKQHTIPSEYYSHYGFIIGDSFKGRFLRYKEGQGVNVEPVSPFFSPGQEYQFSIIEFFKLSAGLEDIMLIEDEYGFTHQVPSVDHVRVGQVLKYRVVKMRKGWPLLEESWKK